jgi:hypothetical protein
VLGIAHPIVLRTAYHMAKVLYAQGKLEEAEVLQQATLLAQKQVLRKDHQHTIDTATSLKHVASKRKVHRSAAENRGASGGGGGGGGSKPDSENESTTRKKSRIDDEDTEAD